MRAIVQRVKEAVLTVEGEIISTIGAGFIVYLGVGENDTEKEAQFLADKVAKVRIFEDDNGKMNKSLVNLLADGKQYEVLAVSNFTLYGECKGQNRPCFMTAAKPDIALRLYDLFCERINDVHKIGVKKGVFGADMHINAHCDGPINIILDTDRL